MATGKPGRSGSSTDERGVHARVADLESAVRSQVGLSVARLVGEASGLSNVGAYVVEALGDTSRDANADELLKRAHLLRGLALYGASVLAQLQCEAGRLEALAAIGRRLED